MKPSSIFLWRLVRYAPVTAVCALAVTFAGCTHTMKIKASSTARIQNPAATKIPLHVGLVLTDQFCSYSHKFENMGDTWVYPFGPTLRDQAISLCEQTFARVTVSTNGVSPINVDVVLSPEVHRSGYAVGPGKFLFSMLVQWTLRDANNRDILWMTTVDAAAADKQKRVFEQLFDELASKGYRAFQDSPEIQRLAQPRKQAS